MLQTTQVANMVANILKKPFRTVQNCVNWLNRHTTHTHPPTNTHTNMNVVICRKTYDNDHHKMVSIRAGKCCIICTAYIVLIYPLPALIASSSEQQFSYISLYYTKNMISKRDTLVHIVCWAFRHFVCSFRMFSQSISDNCCPRCLPHIP